LRFDYHSAPQNAADIGDFAAGYCKFYSLAQVKGESRAAERAIHGESSRDLPVSGMIQGWPRDCRPHSQAIAEIWS
jgi:hypothetical protein